MSHEEAGNSTPSLSEAGATTDFQNESRQSRTGFFTELWHFMRHNKKWWLLPIILVLLILGLMVMLSGTAVAPFLYPLF